MDPTPGAHQMLKQDSRTIIAVFDSPVEAEAAARFLTAWEDSEREVNFATLVLVHETDEGRLKVRNWGHSNMLRGAETGLTVGLVLGLLSGRLTGLALLRTTLGGAVIGAAIGALSQPEPDLSSNEMANLLRELTGGKAGVVIGIDNEHADRLAEEIVKMKGEIM